MSRSESNDRCVSRNFVSTPGTSTWRRYAGSASCADTQATTARACGHAAATSSIRIGCAATQAPSSGTLLAVSAANSSYSRTCGPVPRRAQRESGVSIQMRHGTSFAPTRRPPTETVSTRKCLGCAARHRATHSCAAPRSAASSVGVGPRTGSVTGDHTSPRECRPRKSPRVQRRRSVSRTSAGSVHRDARARLTPLPRSRHEPPRSPR